MKKFLMAVLALVCVSGVALAGPNARGTIVAHDANFAFTSDILDYCGLGTPLSACAAADVNVEGSNDANQRVWKVYAAFCENSAPRLKGMTFGVAYDAGNLILSGYGPCIGDPDNGAAEFPGAGWPAPDTGTSIVWQFTQTSILVEAYWFGGYSYYGTPNVFALRAHPDPILGGNFADDSVPAIQDPIAGFGSIGFDTPGTPACPECGGDPVGACCVGEVCTVTTEAECQGVWQGQDVPCDPNPCLVFGACCVGQECFVVTATECERLGGVYQGDDTLCDPNPCLIFGACCIDGSCFVLTETDCGAQGGTYMGDDVPCDPNPCLNPIQESTWGHIKANYR